MLYALIVELPSLAPGHPVPTAGMQDMTPYYIHYAAGLCTIRGSFAGVSRAVRE
jgi:hypothetical protein